MKEFGNIIERYITSLESETFYQHLQNTIDILNNTDKIIILVDLNARIGREVLPGIKQKYNEEITNEYGELLI